MNLDIESDTPIFVRPILFYVKDHRSRNQLLFFDTEEVTSLIDPSPGRGGLLSFSIDVGQCVLSTLNLDWDGDDLRANLSIPGKPLLTLRFPDIASRAITRGATIAWHRGRTPRRYPPNLIRKKARPDRLLGFVLQEVATPALIHVVFLSERDRDAWMSTAVTAAEDSPAHLAFYRIDAYILRFSPRASVRSSTWPRSIRTAGTSISVTSWRSIATESIRS